MLGSVAGKDDSAGTAPAVAGQAAVATDQASGRLTPLASVSTNGRTPRSFAIDPAGRRLYAANQDSHTIVHFDLDSQTGQLMPNGDVTEVGAPVCILFS